MVLALHQQARNTHTNKQTHKHTNTQTNKHTRTATSNCVQRLDQQVCSHTDIQHTPQVDSVQQLVKHAHKHSQAPHEQVDSRQPKLPTTFLVLSVPASLGGPPQQAAAVGAADEHRALLRYVRMCVCMCVCAFYLANGPRF
jgi:hypothetical protein